MGHRAHGAIADARQGRTHEPGTPRHTPAIPATRTVHLKPGAQMRLVIFTGNCHLDETPWWNVVLGAPDLRAILIVEQRRRRDWWSVLCALRRNVRRHGWLFIPYRAAVAALALLRKPFAARPSPPHSPVTVPVDRISTVDMHQRDVVDAVTAWSPDLGLSLGAPILKPSLFRIPSLGTLNVHLGKVPDFRGAPPGFWELWTGAPEVGATIHWVNEGLDTGPVVEQATAPVYPVDTLRQVEARAEELGAGLLGAALTRVARGTAEGMPQTAGGRTYRFPTLGQRFALWRRGCARRVHARLSSPWQVAKFGAAACCLAVLAPLRDLFRTLRGRHPVRVFAFHRVTDLCRDGMTVRPETFRRQLEFVCRHHQVVGLDQALDVIANRGRLARPLAVITFDDGYRSVVRVAKPFLEERGVTATCFVCTGLLEAGGVLDHDATNPLARQLDLMDWDELRALWSGGWRVGGHTVSHARLSALTGEVLRHEVVDPLMSLHDHLGVDRAAMAYPYGGPDDITPEGASAAREAGYVALFSDFGGENFPGDDLFSLRRIDLGGDHETLMWKVAARGFDLRRWRVRVQGEAAA